MGPWLEVRQPLPFVYISPAENLATRNKKGGVVLWKPWGELDLYPVVESSITFTTMFRTHASNLEWETCTRPIPEKRLPPSSETRTTITTTGLHNITCVSDIFIPTRSAPGRISNILSALQILIGPQMVAHVQVTDMREETADSFIIFLSVFETSSPVVSPFNHGTGLKWNEIKHLNMELIHFCRSL